jgi:hypothetical protein
LVATCRGDGRAIKIQSNRRSAVLTVKHKALSKNIEGMSVPAFPSIFRVEVFHATR